MKKETLCWGCQNFAKCSWARGVPVEGWDATPTKIVHCSKGEKVITESYIVNSCPQYKADKIQLANTRGIAEILNIDKRTVFRYLANKGKKANLKNLRKMLEKQGYILHIYKEVFDDTGYMQNHYYLEKIED